MDAKASHEKKIMKLETSDSIEYHKCSNFIYLRGSCHIHPGVKNFYINWHQVNFYYVKISSSVTIIAKLKVIYIFNCMTVNKLL